MTDAIEDLDNLLEQIQLLLNGSAIAEKKTITPAHPTMGSRFGPQISCDRDSPFGRGDLMAPVVEQVSQHSPVRAPVSRSIRDNSPYWEKHAPVNTMTLPDIFDMLSVEDPQCVVCVRRIHKLGFKSVKYIRQFFNLFGTIRRVIVLPSRQKDISDKLTPMGLPSPVRPSSMCFLVMDSRDSAFKILEQSIYYIGPWPVDVSFFDPHQGACVKKDVSGWERSPSISSVDTNSSY